MHYLQCWPTQGFMGIGGPIVMIIFGIIVIGVLIYLAIAVSRNSAGKSGSSSHRENAMDILKMRFAKGEIGRDEFDSMKKTLLE